MHIRLKGATVLAAAVATASWLGAVPTGQGQSAEQFPPYKAPRTADGKPNLNGIWQSFTTANWDILAHAAQPGPHPELMGAWGAAPGRAGHRRGKRNPVPAVGGGEAEGKLRKADGREGHQRSAPLRYRRTRTAVLPAGRAARQLHALSLSDFSDARTDPDRVRVQGRGAHHLHEQQGRGAERYLDGVVERPLGGRHAGRRRDGVRRPHLVRPGGELPQRRAPRGRTLHARSVRTTSSTRPPSRTRRCLRDPGR